MSDNYAVAWIAVVAFVCIAAIAIGLMYAPSMGLTCVTAGSSWVWNKDANHYECHARGAS